MTTSLVEEAFTLNVPDGNYDLATIWTGMVQESQTAVTAGAFPVAPPKKWFENPRLRELTPLHIDSTGHVFGHIAGWKSDHIGLSAGVKPPRSKSGYAFFQTGALETAEGDFVNVGQITLAGGHAPLDVSVSDAVAHYDDTKSAVMDVACGEDRHGIWVSGALRPSVSDEQLRAIRASSVSGDWRPINNRLEMVAVCAVNCPGFPIPRARVAAGTPVALVAAGTGPIVEKILEDRLAGTLNEAVTATLASMQTRVKRIEDALVERAVVERSKLPSTASASPVQETRLTKRGRPVVASSTRRSKKNAYSKTDDGAKTQKPRASALTAAMERIKKEREAESIVAAKQARIADAKAAKLRKRVDAAKQESKNAIAASLRARAHANT